MSFNQFILVVILGALANVGSASWISSGGESFYDAKNPWFLAHKKSVSWCLKIDQENFSASEEQALQSIQLALNYWKEEFNRGQIGPGKYLHFPLGNNEFIYSEGECKDQDLRFLFGSAALSSTERAYLEKLQNQSGKENEALRNYIGVSVRTEYDSTQLIGKGFIYIASDLGSQKYLTRGDLIEKAWSHSRILSWALLHEIGHTFGIPHSGNSFMSEIFMDQLLSKYNFQDFLKMPFEAFVSSPKEGRRCTLINSTMRKFFDLGMDAACVVGVWMPGQHEYHVLAEYPDGSRKLVGKAMGLQTRVYGIGSRPIAYLRLTQQQKVFTPEQTEGRFLIPGPVQERFKMTGNLLLEKDQRVVPIHLDLSPESISMVAVYNGRLEPVFSYDSPVTFILSRALGDYQ